MSDAVIFVDLESLHPVIDGVYHRGRFTHVPRPGEEIELLCGTKASAGFKNLATRGVVRTCEPCDLQYRKDKHIDVPGQGRQPVPYERLRRA